MQNTFSNTSNRKRTRNNKRSIKKGKQKMKVTLLHYTPLDISDKAIAKCWDKQCETINRERIKRVGIKFKHSSTLEHISYNFDIDGISRACLQELARHRISSFSVKSSRYTLKELKKYDFSSDLENDWEKFLVSTEDSRVNRASINALLKLHLLVKNNVPNDMAKYALPEAYKTSLVWTINLRSLRNFVALRTDKSALWEIRELASSIFKAVPKDHKYLLIDTVKRVSPQMREEHFECEGSMEDDSEILRWYKSEYEE